MLLVASQLLLHRSCSNRLHGCHRRYFTNTNIYTDPFNASVAEYGSLSYLKPTQVRQECSS